MTSPETLHLVCPHCHGTNRVRAADLDSAPDCGHCHRPLVTGAPVALDGTTFDKHVGRSHLPVVVDFWAPWCGPCRMQGPILDEVSTRLGDRAVIAKVNVDEEPQLSERFGVVSIPTLVVLKEGQPATRMVGVQQASTLVAALEAAGA